MKKPLLILLLIILISFNSFQIKGQSATPAFSLHKLKIKADSCGDIRLSSTAYFVHKGNVMDVEETGILKCRLSFELSGESKTRICNIKLAGIDFDTCKKETIQTLKKLLQGEVITVLSAQSRSISDTDFEGIVEYNQYSINYSLLVNGLAVFRPEAYTLDFWTACKYHEAERQFKLEQSRTY
jgi:hypothetical protein